MESDAPPSVGWVLYPPSAAEYSARMQAYIAGFEDWRGQALAEVRQVISGSAQRISEQMIWNMVPEWRCYGVVCRAGVYRSVIKLEFPAGRSLPDPHRLLQVSHETRRAVYLRKGAALPTEALGQLIRDAVAFSLKKAGL